MANHKVGMECKKAHAKLKDFIINGKNCLVNQYECSLPKEHTEILEELGSEVRKACGYDKK